MKKFSLILFSTLLLSQIAHAGTHGKSMGAHSHGSIKIEMAIEGKNIEIDIDGPAESFIGFEYAPKTIKEKTIWADSESLWKKELITKLFILDSALGCTISEASFVQEIDKNHSDIEAVAKINCTRDLAGQSLIVSIKKHFPKLKKLTLELVGSEAKIIEIKSNNQTIKL